MCRASSTHSFNFISLLLICEMYFGKKYIGKLKKITVVIGSLWEVSEHAMIESRVPCALMKIKGNLFYL